MIQGGGSRTLDLFTIGYEGKSLDAFISTLKAAGVRVLVDVRESPHSCKPGFSKTRLAEALAADGIEYVSIRALGAPPDLRHKLREDGDRQAFAAAYRAHLREQADAVEEVISLLRGAAVCLMCYEADPSKCHRGLVVGELQATVSQPMDVVHL